MADEHTSGLYPEERRGGGRFDGDASQSWRRPGTAGEVEVGAAEVVNLPPAQVAWWQDMNRPRPIGDATSPDASKLTFPLQLVIWIVATVLAVAASIWGSTAGLRSDVRDILTRQELEAKADTERQRLLDALEVEKDKRRTEEMENLKKAVDRVYGEARLKTYTAEHGGKD